MSLSVKIVNVRQMCYTNSSENADFIALLDHYAQDKMGGGAPLADSVKTGLVNSLHARADAISLLAYYKKQDDQPQQAVGLLNAFEAFSTFVNKPLINIHDIVVKDGFRGQGVGQQLLAAIEQIASVRGCCKLTLEVLSGNELAKNSYHKYGFSSYMLDKSAGHALFWEKQILEQ
jgi:ribosomal protein S18 acetylase RimI-like enzyme